jgi:diguanylate cyclase (GGDEF)-like protein
VVGWVNGLSKAKSVALTALGMAVVAYCDWNLDVVTKYDWQMTLGYMIPVTFAAWSLGARAGFLAAATAVFLDFMGPGARGLMTRHSTEIMIGTEAAGFVLLSAGAFIMSRMRLHLEIERELSRTDHLTGCWNARAFWEAMRVEKERMSRTGDPLSVIFLDIDDFKAVNDSHGHGFGDKILRIVGQVLVDELRITDIPARLGGDEFAVVLPGATSEVAVKVTDRIRSEVARLATEVGHTATLSAGVVTYDKEPDSVDELLANADRLMYQVKNNGKNSMAFAVN